MPLCFDANMAKIILAYIEIYQLLTSKSVKKVNFVTAFSGQYDQCNVTLNH